MHKTTEKTSSFDKKSKVTTQELRILLVEDEYINQTLAVAVLEREKWKVQVAENGIRAIELLQNAIFDLVLMDIQMPELDGYETTRAIRQQEKNTGKHVPIIAMTAYAAKGDREKCLAAGMDGYISKPINPDKISQEIKTVLQAALSIRPGNQVNPHTP